ncbi:VirK/YbjX family protein [Undibacterium sp. TJN19]|uniref:VirK/YbjX family protein n=1 Tax=Undibacterium sp. TJN19 TaxID=3413055 RepID=UPI003BF29428
MDILNWVELEIASNRSKEAPSARSVQGGSAFASMAWAMGTRFADTNSSFKSKCVFVLRSLLQPATSLTWFKCLHQTYLQKAVHGDASLLDAIHRPFFDHTIACGARLKLLSNHFRLSGMLLGTKLAQDLASGKPYEIATVSGKNHEEYSLALFWGSSFKREGGMTLGLFLQGKLLQCMTFSFDRENGQTVLRVGGVQACNQGGRDLIRESTKGLHGIQPRLLLIDALRCIAREINCAAIECIAKKNHIYQAWRYKFKKNIRAEYDALWVAAGGVAQANGNYRLPLVTQDKPLSERPTNKRSEYRAREQLTLAMRNDIACRLPLV